MSDHPGLPGGRTRPTDRDHDQRHPRLPDRETADQSARTAGDRPLGQPAPARRPTTQPQPDPRRRGVHRRAPADHHRHRGPDPRAAPGRPPRPRPAASPADVPAAPGAGSPTATYAACSPTFSAHHDDHRRADELRPAPAPRARAHHPHPRALTATGSPTSACTTRCCSPTSRPDCCCPAWPSSPTPTHPPQHPAHRRPQLPASPRSTHPGSRTRRLILNLTRSFRLRRTQLPSLGRRGPAG